MNLNLRHQAIIEILNQLRKERDVLQKAVEEARQAATHDENRAEDQHDTRGVEASYLAAGQGKRLAELEEQIIKIEALKQLPESTVIKMGSLVELENQYVFLAATGGGTQFQLNGKSGLVISPASPLGDALQNQKAGDEIEVESGKQTKVYKILTVM